MNNGFIKLHRQMMEWEWYTEPIVLMLFIHCLFKANIKDKNWKGITIKRGEFITSTNHLANELNISTMQVRTALKKLIVTNEVTKQSTSQYTKIQIVNYCKYQDVTSIVTNEQQTNNKPITTTKELKNIKNNKSKQKKDISIEERKLAFKELIRPYAEKYSAEMLFEFYGHWTAPLQKKPNVMLFEEMKTFAIGMRLSTWKKRGDKFKNGNNG